MGTPRARGFTAIRNHHLLEIQAFDFSATKESFEVIAEDMSHDGSPQRLKFGACSPEALSFILSSLLTRNIPLKQIDLPFALNREARHLALELLARSSDTLEFINFRKTLLPNETSEAFFLLRLPCLQTLSLSRCCSHETHLAFTQQLINLLPLSPNLSSLSLRKSYLGVDAIEAVLIALRGS